MRIINKRYIQELEDAAIEAVTKDSLQPIVMVLVSWGIIEDAI